MLLASSWWSSQTFARNKINNFEMQKVTMDLKHCHRR
jgi:hypothetical protein